MAAMVDLLVGHRQSVAASRRARSRCPQGARVIGLTVAAVVAAGPAPVGTSWYVGDLDPGRLTALGTADAGRAGGAARSVSVLDFGDPAAAPGSTALPDRRGTASPGQTQAAVSAYARGWLAAPAHPQLVLVVGTSNFGSYVDAAHGTAWGRLVEATAAEVGPAVEVRGGVDAEPGYAGPVPTRAFVRAYLAATGQAFVDFGDCACTAGQALPGDWTLDDRVAVATAGSLLPQVYRTSGIDARRWATLDARARSVLGHPLRVLGALTQTRACAGRACTGIDLAPALARSSLGAALGRDIPVGTDIGYLSPPAPSQRRGGLLLPALGVVAVLAAAGTVGALVRRRRGLRHR